MSDFASFLEDCQLTEKLYMCQVLLRNLIYICDRQHETSFVSQVENFDNIAYI